MDRRCSLNGTYLSSPIAESTCLNGTSSGTNFPWGATAISPKQRSNSVCMDKSSSLLNRSRSSQMQSPVRAKIDPRIYADVQSRGLASRIVKYHEDGQRLSRSMSVNNIYSKPGQFPIVHLNVKKDLPYKATNQNVSMTRIPPPNKSMFCGNTLSGLLRSSSIVGLNKTEDIAHENRPILHPPPTENELAPTRSVIDVLKEISRKRINSDETEHADANKKYCSREYTDHVDNGLPQTNDNFGNTPSSSTNKRQREQLNSPQRTVNRLNTTKERHLLSQHHSPEQIAKKRQCTYNNDISSSLSSSITQSNKRKLNETVTKSPPLPQNTANTSSINDSYAVQKSKILRYQQNDLRFENISKSLSCNTPITPIPNTPYSHQQQTNVSEANEIAPAQRTASAPIYSTLTLPLKQHIKPKLTLFNTKCDDDERTEETNDDVIAGADDDEGIQFIKPKKAQATIGTKNALIERTKQSKLASLLAGLRGELYVGNDEIDTVANAKTSHQLDASTAITTNSTLNKANTTSAALTMTTNTTNSTTTTTSILGINSMKSSANADNTNLISAHVQNSSTAANGTGLTNTANPLTGGFKLNTVSTANESSNKQSVAVSAAGGFKFTPPTTTAAGNNDTSTTNVLPANFSMAPPTTPTSLNTSVNRKSPPKVTSPLVGLKLSPQTTTSTVPTSISTSAATVPILGGFTFTAGNATSLPAASTPNNNTQSAFTVPASANKTFNFSTSAANSSAATATTTISAAVPFGANKPVFSFGTPTTAPVTTASASVTPTFGAITANAAQTQPFGGFATTGAQAQPQPPVNVTQTFNFGAANTDASTTANKAQPVLGGTVATALGSEKNAFSSAKPATMPFTFGNTAASTAATATTTGPTTAAANTNLFSFGTASAESSKPIATAAPFSFANNAATATAQPMAKPTATTTPFTFGGIATTTAETSTPKNFQFSGPFGAATNTTAQIPATTNNNIFGNSATTKPDTATSASPALFAFGSNVNANATPAATASSSIFGSKTNTPNMPFAFGSTTNNSASGNSNQQTNSLFGTATTNSTPAAANTNAPFTFGSTNSAAVPTQDPAKPSPFAFGGTVNQTTKPKAAENNIFGSTTAATNGFGSTVAAVGAPQGSFSFGSGNTSSNATVATPNTTFGALSATSNQSKTFTFGANSTPSKDTPPNSIFGQTATTANDAKPFAFGAVPSSNSPFNKSAGSTPFAFGASSNTTNNNNSNTPAPFSFGATNANSANTQPNAAAPAAKQFTFGASTTTATQNGSTPSGNIFGTSNSILGAPPAGTPLATAQGDRVIRRATRRLQK